ncbi:MAG: hypothetical protein U1D06_11650, partial [Paracoccaceae bacterium]|nr:hypothetical protein [Paracoccaceae bacterium]
MIWPPTILPPTIWPDSPRAPTVQVLLQRHLDLMHAASPPESVHALDADALDAPDIAFFTLREGRSKAGTLLGMGAL